MGIFTRNVSQQAIAVFPDDEDPLGDETLSVPVTAGGVALGASVPVGTRHVYIQDQGSSNVRIRPNVAGAPTASNGLQILAGNDYDFTSDPTLYKVIAETATTSLYLLYF